MPRPRLIPTAVLFALAFFGVARPAMPAPIAIEDLERLQAIAAQEGLPVKLIRAAGPKRLLVRSEEPLAKDAFIKRASLLAYYAFNRLPQAVEAIAFENAHGGIKQTCAIAAADHAQYLQDRITKTEYERRLAYRQDGAPAPATAPTVALPPIPRPALPSGGAVAVPAVPQRPAAPAVPSAPSGPLAVGLTPLVGFAYGLGGTYDSYMVEYGHPVLATLDARPSLQIVSPFSPVTFMAGAGRPVEGLSLACDLMGTTRQTPGVQGLSFEGGLGARVGTWQGATLPGGMWPAMHLRLGMRWHALAVGMRYPLMTRAGDPSAGWEANIGIGVPLSTLFGGK
jgi:hypothetical protein